MVAIMARRSTSAWTAATNCARQPCWRFAGRPMADQLLTTALPARLQRLGKARHVALNRSHAELHSVALAPDHALGSQLDSDAVDFGCVRENVIHTARDGQHEMVAIVETAQGSMKATSGHGPGAVGKWCTVQLNAASRQHRVWRLTSCSPLQWSTCSPWPGSWPASPPCGRSAAHAALSAQGCAGAGGGALMAEAMTLVSHGAKARQNFDADRRAA